MLGRVAGVLASAGLHGQTTASRGRALTILPDSAIATSDYGTMVDRLVRADELRLRLERSDTLMAGRRVEQLTQYYKGPRVWGWNVSMRFDAAVLVSVFGTV